MAMRLRVPLAVALILAVVAIVVVALVGLTGHSSRPAGSSSVAADLSGSELPPGLRAHDFTLTDQNGKAVSLSDYRGQVVILTFISSSCPRVCVVVAQQIRGALDELSQHVPVLAISTDPSADSRARTDRFLSEVSLSGRMEYLSGPAARLSSIWRAYGIASADVHEVHVSDANALVLLVDRQGLERVSFSLEELTPEALSTQVRKLQR